MKNTTKLAFSEEAVEIMEAILEDGDFQISGGIRGQIRRWVRATRNELPWDMENDVFVKFTWIAVTARVRMVRNRLMAGNIGERHSRRLTIWQEAVDAADRLEAS